MRSWPAAELLEQPCGLAEQRRAALSTVIRLVGLTSLWYLTAIVALVSAKLSVSSLHAPLVLCASQFTTATVLTAVLLRMHESPPPKAPPPREAATVLRRLAAAYSLGFVFTNAALAHAPAPYVETVKSSEPISTVLLAAVLLGERESAASYCALLPVCIGVGMASLSGGAGGGGSGGGGGGWDARLAFVLCLCANVGFSTRAVLAKRLRQVHAQAHAQPSPHPVQRGESKGGEGKGGGGGSSGASGDVRLFFEVSWRGAALLMPAAALLEGGALLQAPSGFAWGAYAARLALNGAAYSMYNLLSFMVLSCVSVTTHAVLNAVRRLVMILFTSYFFGEPRTLVNTIGVLVAVAGVCAYALASKRAVPAPHRTDAFDRTV